jgi:hypothetical protein
MDHGQPSAVFMGAAVALVLGVVSAGLVGLGVRGRGRKPS